MYDECLCYKHSCAMVWYVYGGDKPAFLELILLCILLIYLFIFCFFETDFPCVTALAVMELTL